VLIEESFQVTAPIDRDWQFIRDPQSVGPCLPGCRGIEAAGPNTYTSTIKVGLGPIKTSFKVGVELIAEAPPSYAKSLTVGEEFAQALKSRLEAP